MQVISSAVAAEFCGLCHSAYETWVIHKHLFDKNTTKENNISKAKPFMDRLSGITHEYALLQIAKLHDPAVQRTSVNLTIDFIIRYGDWNSHEKDTVEDIRKALDELFVKIKTARNKALVHNDLDALMDGKPLGSFPDGLDTKYFAALSELVRAVSAKWCNYEYYPFDDRAADEVDQFLDVLGRA